MFFDVIASTLGKTINKKCPLPLSEQDDSAVSSSFTFARSGDPLFDDTAAQISINKSLIRPGDCLLQCLVLYLFLTCKTAEPGILENTQFTLLSF